MSMTDPVADYLTRIRNALMANFESVEIPSSRVKVRLTEILKEEGYIENFSILEDQKSGLIHIDLKWLGPKQSAITALERVSKPSQRRYVKGKELPKVRNGHGIAIISTSQGIMTDQSARSLGVGGEYICSVY